MTRQERNARRRLQYHLLRAMKIATKRGMRWGVDDCALWHADIDVAAMNRGDPAASFRGRYKTKRGAHRVLGLLGLPLALRQAADAFGCRRIKPSEAKVGDLGIMPMDGAFSTFRMLHRDEWIGRNEAGYSMAPTKLIKYAWSAI